LDSTGGTVGARIGYADDRNGDDSIEDGWQALDTSVSDGKHERGVLGVGARCEREEGLVRWDAKTNNKKGDDVEQRDTPENLLGGFGNGLSWVIRFGGGETDELSATESKGCYNEARTETRKSVLESTRIPPVSAANISTVVGGNTSAVDDYTENDEADDRSDFDAAEDKFDLAVAFDTADIDDGDGEEEKGNPNSHVIF
jgi:hypothetical protein